VKGAIKAMRFMINVRGILLSGLLVFSWHVQAAKCNVFESAPKGIKYNHLMCKGVEYFNSKKFLRASSMFAKALSVEIPNYPNFKLLPRYAYALAKSGKRRQAKALLKQAELANKIFVGQYVCHQQGLAFFEIKQRNGKNVVSDRAMEKAVKRMCDLYYMDIYDPDTVEGYLLTAKEGVKVLENYMKYQNLIESNR